ncbi:hypothetical protein OOK31_10800 [Streptomyces sp. NBC_00249]|nr:hypothetical protein [Streptomyces sp. NBC_00249]MCX5194380.1 hypothetical protein [Streptomyces sp. NBC_00249]
MFCTLCGDDNGEKTGSDHEIGNCPWRDISEKETELMLGVLRPFDRSVT